MHRAKEERTFPFDRVGASIIVFSRGFAMSNTHLGESPNNHPIGLKQKQTAPLTRPALREKCLR
jgi:hypothetical protein